MRAVHLCGMTGKQRLSAARNSHRLCPCKHSGPKACTSLLVKVLTRICLSYSRNLQHRLRRSRTAAGRRILHSQLPSRCHPGYRSDTMYTASACQPFRTDCCDSRYQHGTCRRQSNAGTWVHHSLLRSQGHSSNRPSSSHKSHPNTCRSCSRHSTRKKIRLHT